MYADALNEVFRYGLEDHSNFLHKIAENVDEHTPQLVYADWLEEQGKPAHAHFIRRSVEGQKDRWAKVSSGQEFGSTFTTMAKKHADTDFATHGAILPFSGRTNTSNIDLSSQHVLPDGSRLIWHVGGLEPEEGRKLRDSLAAEGAHAGPITSDENDPHWQKHAAEHYATVDAVLRYSQADEGSFHTALTDNIKDPTHHLIFADFVQDQGKEATAQFIRTAAKFVGEGSVSHWATPHAEDGWKLYHWGDDVGGHLTELLHTHNGHTLSWRHTTGVFPEEAVAAMTKEGAKWLGDGTEPEKHRASDEVVKYSAVPDHEVHPDYQPTGVAPRIGHLLKQLSAENSDAGLLAEGIARTGDSSLLKILADKLDDDGHPLKDAIDWRHAERGVKIDKALQHHIDNRSKVVYQHLQISPVLVAYDWKNGNRSSLPKRAALAAIKTAVPDAKQSDMVHSILRLWMRDRLRDHKEGPEPPDWLVEMHNQYAKELGADTDNPHKYPDTRPANKRTYSLKELVAKYGAYKSPSGGLVVKESPYAVVGNYSTGGAFTRDLTQLNTEPAETQPQKPKLAELLKRWRKRRTK